jgi:F-type H+-transporting ATPase subunit delta
MSGNRSSVAQTTSGASGVAERYANALFALAVEADAVAGVEQDLDGFVALMTASADFARLVRSPVFSADAQVRAVSAVLARAGIGGLVANLVKLAASNRRLFAVPDVVDAYKRLAAAHRGEVSADVTSAEPLAEAHVAALKQALKASLGKDVTLHASVDPGLIGGLVVRVGSRMIDGSLRTKLNSLRLAMKEVG